jgi:eukaryotic-like serine/threonine-protein kinase
MTGNGEPISPDADLQAASPEESELAQVLEAYFAALEAGHSLDRERLLADHPAIAGSLRACLGILHLAGRVSDVPEAIVTAEPNPVASSLATLWEDSGSAPRVLLREPPDEPNPLVMARSAEMPELRDNASSRYRLLGEIARGGMGVVFKGYDDDLGRSLAIKVLLDRHRGNADVLRRFVEEAQIGGQLQHPGIVPVHDLGVFPDRRPYFAMKLVQGRTLAALLAERSDPTHDLPRFLGIFEQVCQTVAYAHSRRVIHRDLKPSNVMVGSFGEVQVMDWGLAKVLPEGGVADERKRLDGAEDVTQVRTLRTEVSGSESQAGSVLGTPAYMAPEQARGEIDRIDERSDVFGLGAILCEILTGRPPYAGLSRGEVQAQAARADLTDALAQLDSCGAGEELTQLARDCMAARPSDRPRDAGAVARRITAYTTGAQERLRAVELAKAKAQARATEERKRRKLAVGLASALVGLVVTLGGGSAWWAYDRQARAARVDTNLRGAEVLLSEAEREGDDLSKWSAAREAANQLGSLVAEARDKATRERVASLIKAVDRGLAEASADRRLLDELVAIWGDFFAETPEQSGSRYADAFRDRGIDPDVMSAADAGRAIAGRPPRVAVAMTSALDSWTTKRRMRGDRIGAERVDAAARQADPDPWRNRLRSAEAEPDLTVRKEALIRLARETTDKTPAVSVTLLGGLLLATGEAAEAEAVLRPARDREPNNAWLNVHLARSLELLGRSEEAIRYFMAAQAGLPESANALAHALLARGETDGAIRVYRDLTRRRPDEPIHFGGLWEALKSQGRVQDANAALDDFVASARRSLRRRPGSAGDHYFLGLGLRSQGDDNAAIAEFREATRLDPDHPHAHFDLGNALKARGELDAAITELREALRLKPNLAEVHYNLGTALNASGNVDEAIDELREAIRLKPDYAEAHCNLGLALGAKGGVDAAIAEYRQAIQLKPNLTEPHFNLGVALNARKEFDAAINEYRQAIQLNPDYAEAHDNLGTTLCSKGEIDAGIAEFREAIRLKPDHANTHNNLGFALYSQGKVDAAIDSYREAIRLKPDYAKAHNNFGSALRSKGEFGAAIAVHREAIRLKPDNATAHFNIGIALCSKGEFDAGIVAYREAIRLKPNFAEALYNLGVALHTTGDVDGAIDAWRQARDRTASNPGRIRNLESLLAGAEQEKRMAARLPAVLRGDDRPGDANEQLSFALMCHAKELYAAAARLFADALSANPALADDRKAQHPYNAACVAALAGSGKGEDNPAPDEAARVKLRQQALDWLKAELASWTRMMDRDARSNVRVAEALQHWKTDADLAGVRDTEELAKLPEAEKASWRALWGDVDRLLTRAGSR